MKPDASDSRTLRPAAGYIEGVLQTMVEFHHPDVPTYDVLEWDTPLDSSDFSPQCWIRLAEQIEEHYYVSTQNTARCSSGNPFAVLTPCRCSCCLFFRTTTDS